LIIDDYSYELILAPGNNDEVPPELGSTLSASCLSQLHYRNKGGPASAYRRGFNLHQPLKVKSPVFGIDYLP
jgi:hypothetical protein